MDEQKNKEEMIGRIIANIILALAALGLLLVLGFIPGLLPFIGMVAIIAFFVTITKKQ